MLTVLAILSISYILHTRKLPLICAMNHTRVHVYSGVSGVEFSGYYTCSTHVYSFTLKLNIIPAICFLSFPRLGYIFWATAFPSSIPKISRAQLDGSNITIIADNDIRYICTYVGLTEDGNY